MCRWGDWTRLGTVTILIIPAKGLQRCLNKHADTHTRNRDTPRPLYSFQFSLFFSTLTIPKHFNRHWSILKICTHKWDSLFNFFPHFVDLVSCGNDDAELWSAALLESVIIPSGQSVWHSAVTFRSPPSSPLVRHNSLPPQSTGKAWS